jgi:ribokinase
MVDILVVNESEARMLAAVPSVTRDTAGQAASLLHARGPAHVLVSLGEHGVTWVSADGIQHFEAMPVRPVDTTGAGDTFIGALAALLIERRPMQDAIRHAMRAAAICVTRPGAQASMPSRQEVAEFSPGV